MTDLAAKVRLADVAKEAGVSVSTVSRVLSGAPGISDEVTRSIQALAARMGYGGRARRAIGPLERVIFFSRLQDFGALAGRFPTEVLAGARDEAQAHGLEFNCLPAATGAMSSGLTASIGGQGRTGVIFQSIDDEAFIESFVDKGFPVLALNNDVIADRYDVLLPDNAGGGAAAAREFRRLGHESAAILMSSNRATIQRRASSFANQFRLLGGVAHDDDRVILAMSTPPEETRETLRKLLAGPRKPTAIFCTVDLLAVACLGALADLHLKAPDDVSIIGFDDLPVASLTTPPLSTIAIDRRHLGVLAVRRLLERAREPEAPALRIEVATQLVRRGSSGVAC
ncbi:MAG: LacI family DNA-binding transcriptional regulator [Beijerinckiaceae bacterium]